MAHKIIESKLNRKSFKILPLFCEDNTYCIYDFKEHREITFKVVMHTYQTTRLSGYDHTYKYYKAMLSNFVRPEILKELKTKYKTVIYGNK